MPPIPLQPTASSWQSRIVCYFQTYHSNGEYVSLLPLITNPSGVTHVILAAIHVNPDPSDLRLNDDPPDHAKYDQLWEEVKVLQRHGVKVLAMLGGAARGSFARLDYSESRTDVPLARFEAYYAPLRDLLRRRNLDGIDLDIEEEMSLPGVAHLIDRLRADFGSSSSSSSAGAFLITLAPVATALMPGRPHLSGFDYRLLEAARGSEISWYNVQFYNGWGGIDTPAAYDEIMRLGNWRPERVVAGMLTNPRHGGSGYVALTQTAAVLSYLVERYPTFGGVMGWEYWQSLPQADHPWMWSCCMQLCMGMKTLRDAAVIVAMGNTLATIRV
ncbi:hypothetical protein DV737_g480, partial [Chaetothyriales sp. CBS 132003]